MSDDASEESARMPNASLPTETKGITLAETLEWGAKIGAIVGCGLLLFYCVENGLPLRGNWDELLALFAQWAIVGIAVSLLWTVVSIWPGLAIRVMRAEKLPEWSGEQRLAAGARTGATFVGTSLLILIMIVVRTQLERHRCYGVLAGWDVAAGSAALLLVPMVALTIFFLQLRRPFRARMERASVWLASAVLAMTGAGVWLLIRFAVEWPDWLSEVMVALGLLGTLTVFSFLVPLILLRWRARERPSRSGAEIWNLGSGGLLFLATFFFWLLLRADLLEKERWPLVAFFGLGVVLNTYLSTAVGALGPEWNRVKKVAFAPLAISGVFVAMVLVLVVLPPLVNWCAAATRTGNYRLAELWLKPAAADQLQMARIAGGRTLKTNPVLKNVLVVWSVGDSWIVEVPGTRGTPVRLQLKEEDLQSPAPSRWPARR